MTEQKKQNAKAGATTPTTVAVIEKTIADSVLNKIKVFMANGDIRLPANYSPENALKSAWLILLETKTSKKDGERPVLETCTKDSIANTMLNMVLQGLNPVKKQCDFIAYGSKLTLQREYHGTIALAKRYGAIKEPVGNVVYEGDEFEYSIDDKGYKHILNHVQTLGNIDNDKIIGAYATLLFEDPDRQPYVEIMTMRQIQQAWMQGPTKGDSPAHRNFPDEMAKKTVISRACKLFISSSDDSSLEDEFITNERVNARQAITAEANAEEITIDTSSEVVKDPPKKTPAKDTNQQEDTLNPPDPMKPQTELFEQQKRPGF